VHPDLATKTGPREVRLEDGNGVAPGFAPNGLVNNPRVVDLH
jgi:hypothetical protein